MIERRRHAIGDNGERQPALDGVEVADGDAALDDLQSALRQQRHHIGGGFELFRGHLDALFAKIALLDRDHGRRGADAARDADADVGFLRERGRGEKRERGGGEMFQHENPLRTPVGVEALLPVL